MSDLISRSQLINALKLHFDSCFRENGELLYSDHICTSDDVVDLIKLVENQPTAYDIDKVVEELEKATQCIKINEKPTSVKAIHPTQAIEIVKQGIVSDDVCEWKVKSNYYVTKCSHDTDVMYGLKQDFKYCPYCSKKIKVVE